MRSTEEYLPPRYGMPRRERSVVVLPESPFESPGADCGARDLGLDDDWEAFERRRLAEQRRRTLAYRRRKARIRRNRLVAVLSVLILSIAGYSVAGLVSGGATGASRPALVQKVTLAGPTYVVPGHLSLRVSWPTVGEGAIGMQGVGVMAASPRQRMVPIASMTKMMSAIVLLHDHPLPLGQFGPTLVMTAADARQWVVDSQNGDSTVPVRVGERLSEYQLLEGLLMSSGDNIAELLARWDAGSIRAFVAKMNATAKSLGLMHTHYADASGLAPASRSTPSDQVVVASTLMQHLVARKIVSQRSIPFPVAGTIGNYNPALGTDGIIGVKSGFTQAAAGCLAVAAMRSVGGHQVVLISVVTGSPNALYGAATTDKQLLADEVRALRVTSPIRSRSAVVSVRTGGAVQRVGLHLAGPLPQFVLWRGAKLSTTVRLPNTALTGTPASGDLVVSSGPFTLRHLRVRTVQAGGAR